MKHEFLLAEIAKLYYLDQMKQRDIAEIFKITPIQISRFLKQAIDSGIVHFHISMPVEIDPELGKKIKDKYNLRECIVFEGETEGELKNRLSLYISEYIMMLLQEDSIVGLSWGRGIYEIVKQFPYAKLRNCRVVQLSGGAFSANNYMVTPAHIVTLASERIGGIPVFINAPFFASNIETVEALNKEASAIKINELCQLSKVNIIGTSPLSDKNTMTQMGILKQSDIDELTAAGAIGDIAGFFVDKNGKDINWSRHDLYTGASLETISKAETVICIAIEEIKIDIIRAGLKRKCFNVLAISKTLAELLLK